MEVSPVEYVVIAFPGNRFRGEMLKKLVESGTVRILDLVFAALLVWVNTLAAAIAGAIRRAGGQLVAHERIPAPVFERALEAAAA